MLRSSFCSSASTHAAAISPLSKSGIACPLHAHFTARVFHACIACARPKQAEEEEHTQAVSSSGSAALSPSLRMVCVKFVVSLGARDLISEQVLLVVLSVEAVVIVAWRQ